MLKRLAQPEELAAKSQNMAPDLLSKMLSVQFLVSTRGTYSSLSEKWPRKKSLTTFQRS